jgi:hypothetical protein
MRLSDFEDLPYREFLHLENTGGQGNRQVVVFSLIVK